MRPWPRIFFCDEFELPLPPEHRFPMAKYRLLRQRILESGRVPAGSLSVPSPATDEQLERAHDPDYVRRVVRGELDTTAIRRLGFPWSSQLVERSRRSVGGTLAAARAALEDGVSVNLAGGTHHAFFDRGEGYCVFNDAAVAIRTLQSEGRLVRAAVIDCDVHQGDGTAAIFDGDASVATYSIHGRRNYPFRKWPGTSDVALEDGAGDEEYLSALETTLPPLLERHAPELAIYVSGADAWQGDRLGRLALTKEGLARRDRYVFRLCGSLAIPVAVVMAGGYAPEVDDIVEIHAGTVVLAVEYGRKAEQDGIMDGTPPTRQTP